ncbi:MAG: GMC family oxidoreductase N-terminal domain-containing protein, partial [Pseudomonadota bacterium]
ATVGTVCVIEAGGDNDRLMVNVPAGFVHNLKKPELMWQFGSEPGPNTAGRSVYIPQGKLLGGSTSINGLIYNRGQAADFDHWASLGNPGWSYQDVLPYFRKSETFDGPASQYRGASGPLRTGGPEQSHPLCDTFIDAVAALANAPVHTDYNGAVQCSTGYYQRYIHRGRRENVAARFLKPALATGRVQIERGTLAERLLFDGKRATGIEVSQGGARRQLYARQAVLVCAGTANSAALLQRSGVGDGAHLQGLGIDVVHHLPGVGENFSDHYFVRAAIRLKAHHVTLNQQSTGWRLGAEILKWLAGRPSILAWSPSIAYAFLNAQAVLSGEGSATDQPDLQFVFSHGSYRPGRVYELDTVPAVTCGFTQQRPHSRGHVCIRSADPHDTPSVQPNYLVDERDQNAAVDGMQIVRRIIASPGFAPLVEHETVPGAEVQSREAILQFARETGNTGYHLVGTCKLGPTSDPLAVVDTDLCVHGLEGLRVIDASVMPTVTSSNTCAATTMIGEKGADSLINPH